MIWVIFYKHIAIWAPTKNCPLADSFRDLWRKIYDKLCNNYRNGWRQDVVNQCLEFDQLYV